ncbi:MAG: 2-oxoacid:acceptor oxidoreductase family protein [Pseudobdellovibrionaceae bacterium]
MWFFNKEKISAVKRSVVSIRMEAIGGQGANSAGKILAEAAVIGMGYTGNHFSSFGSEKRGTPVRSFVRFSPDLKPVRTASFIRKPDLLVIFHESLLWTHQEIFEGVNAGTDVIINTKRHPKDIKFPQGLDMGRVICIDATQLAVKNNCGLNAIMLGAFSTFCHEVDRKILQETLDTFFSKLPEQVRKYNSQGFQSGHDKLNYTEFRRSQASQNLEAVFLPEMGWANAPIGGVITNPGNSILKNHTASRKGFAPRFTKDVCFNCGYCDMVCPDYCFVWKKDPTGHKAPELQGIDYQYCKGCQKCVTVCPVQALTLAVESEIPSEEMQCRLFPEVDLKKMTES